MVSIIGTLFVVVVFTSAAFPQETRRGQKIQNIFDLRSQITTLENDILQPDPKDLADARKQGSNAIRILPREKYDNVLGLRGGGAYYSFLRKTHEYGRGSDISLEQNKLKVGFAGVDYGFLIDLGKTALTDVGGNVPEMDFLVKYRPPADKPTIRAEQQRSRSYDVGVFVYKDYLPAIVGHTYGLRSINFSDSDVLVAFSIHRKDADGSIIVFWKLLETFVKPEMRREEMISGQ